EAAVGQAPASAGAAPLSDRSRHFATEPPPSLSGRGPLSSRATPEPPSSQRVPAAFPLPPTMPLIESSLIRAAPVSVRGSALEPPPSQRAPFVGEEAPLPTVGSGTAR